LFTLVTTLYGIIASAFFVGRARTGERWWPVAFVNSFAHLLMLPAVILLPIFVLTGRRWLLLTQVVPFYTFLENYGRLFNPLRLVSRSAIDPNRRELLDAETSSLRLMTYNLHKEAHHLDSIVAVIREIGADVVAFQELSQTAAARFESEFGILYPYRALHPQFDPWRGQGILSRYPIQTDEYWSNLSVPESMGHQRVELEVHGLKVTLCNTHPVHPGMEGGHIWFDTRPRREEIGIVLERAMSDDGPVIITGDFNMPDQAEDYQYITTDLADAYAEVGWGMGFTFPDLRYLQATEEFGSRTWPIPPFLRLDYVFHNTQIKAVDASVWPDSGGSDHRPLVVTLRLK
jgi:endonuclease/exonuclease/phosphatase (EEP) superfamily protein YafD